MSGLINHYRYCRSRPLNGVDETMDGERGRSWTKGNEVQDGEQSESESSNDNALAPWNMTGTMFSGIGSSNDHGVVGEDEEEGGSSENESRHPTIVCDNRGVETVAVNLCMIERKCGKKSIEELITNMRRDDFNLDDFLRQVRNIDDCKNICKSILTRSLSAFHFEEKTIQTGDRKFSTKIYVRNAVELLKRQIEHADKSCFYVQTVRKVDKDGQRCFSHFVETEFARRLEEEHCRKVKSHASLDVMWMKREDTGRD